MTEKYISDYKAELPLISVIMPSYNSADTIERAVLSCMQQSYPNVELIIADNGSTDNSVQTAGRLCESFWFRTSDGSLKPRIRLLVQDNRGVSSARNKAIREAGGSWFVSLDSDDYYEADTVETLYTAVCDGKADVSICGIRKVWEQEPSRNVDYKPQSFSGSLNEFTDTAFVGLYDQNLIGTHSNKLYNTELVRKHEIYYNEELSVNEDLDFVLRYLAVCARAAVVPYVFLSYVQHERGQSLINTFQPHGLKGSLIVLGSCNALFDRAGTCSSTVAEMDRRLFVHICSFAGLMYYRSDFDEDRIKAELYAMCDNEDFKALLKRLKPVLPKDRLAHTLLKHRLIPLYDLICRKVYRKKA